MPPRPTPFFPRREVSLPLSHWKTLPQSHLLGLSDMLGS